MWLYWFCNQNIGTLGLDRIKLYFFSNIFIQKCCVTRLFLASSHLCMLLRRLSCLEPFSHSSQWGAFPTALGAISILEYGAEVMLSCDQEHSAETRCQLLLNTERKEEYERNRAPSWKEHTPANTHLGVGALYFDIIIILTCTQCSCGVYQLHALALHDWW